MIKNKKSGQVDIIIGLPSYNEADTIGNVTRQVDRGLVRLKEKYSGLIINADNNSPDDTGSVFLGTETESPKVYISTGKNMKGKGRNILNILKEAKRLQAKHVIFFDTDIKSIEPEWVVKHVEVLERGYDFVVPYYARNRYDGSITNHLAYPLTVAFFGKDIRQPIGGDFSLSAVMVDHLLKQQWNGNTLTYGVDIFLTINAIISGYPIAQVYLGIKDHKPSLPKLSTMYPQVASILFSEIVHHQKHWDGETAIQNTPTFFKGTRIKPVTMKIDFEYVKQKVYYEFDQHADVMKKYFPPFLYKEIGAICLKKKAFSMGIELWFEALQRILFLYRENELSHIKLLGVSWLLFLMRQASFIKETRKKTVRQTEATVIRQAKYFFKHRNKFFNALRP